MLDLLDRRRSQPAGEEVGRLLEILTAIADRGNFQPRAVGRRVHVDPRHEPVPGLLVELHVVVAFAEHLHQGVRVGMIVGHGNDTRALPVPDCARTAAVRNTTEETGTASTACSWARRAAGPAWRLPSAWLAVVTAHAISVENRLHFAIPTEPAHRAVPRRDRATAGHWASAVMC